MKKLTKEKEMVRYEVPKPERVLLLVAWKSCYSPGPVAPQTLSHSSTVENRLAPPAQPPYAYGWQLPVIESQ